MCAENRRLRERLKSLEKQLRENKRQATPFGGRNKSKKSKGTPGRKRGQGNFSRRQRPPESDTKTVRATLGRCPGCGGELEDKKTHEHFQSDIPPVKPVHLRFVTESGWCPRCQRRFRSRHPGQTSTATGAAGVSIGPNAKAIAAEMKHRLGVSYEKISDMFRTVFGLKVTPGGLCQSNRRLAQKARPVYQGLIRALRRAPAAWSDETGWRIGALSAWLWAIAARRTLLYTIRRGRGHQVLTSILGSDFKGVLHSDCFMAYDSKELRDWTQQRCLAHLLRQVRELEQSKSRGAVRFPRKVLAVLKEALALEERKAGLCFSEFQDRLRDIQKRLDQLISEHRNFTDPDNRRFAKRLRRQRGRLFTFLTHEAAEPTNNRAERAIRPAVVARKMGACNKTETGAETHAILASILATAKQRGLQTVAYLRSLASSPPRSPPPLPAFSKAAA